MIPDIDLDQPLPLLSTLSAAPTETLLSDVEALLRSLVSALGPAIDDPDPGSPGRPRVLPAFLLWTALLVCTLRHASSRRAIWRLLASRGLWSYPRIPVGDQAVDKRLDAAGTAPLEQLFAQLTTLLQARLSKYADTTLAPFASAVVAIDETSLDPVARILPSLRPLKPGDSRLLPGKLSSIFDIRLQQWRTIIHQQDPNQNEKVAARSLLKTIEKGALILADLGYFGFEWFDDLTKGGYHWVSRLRETTSYTVLHRYYEKDGVFDGLIFLGAYRADRAAHAVRLVQVQVGKRRFEYITNVLDPQQLPMHELARLYLRRWDIELGFKLVKRHLGLHLLWSGKQVGVLQQVWAVLIIAQILQALQVEIAGRAGVKVEEVSMALLVEYLPQFSARGLDGVAEFVEQGRVLGFIRPSSRTKVKAPVIEAHELVPVPEGLVLVRKARYARRKCGPRAPV